MSTTVGDVLAKALPNLTEAALAVAGWTSAAEAGERIEDLLAMADEWARGRLPLAEVRRLCSPQERFLLARSVRPMPKAFAALLDALIATTDHPEHGPVYVTKHGTFHQAELSAVQARYVADPEHGFRIEFPFRCPWRSRPNKDKGESGKRGDPVFVAGARARRRAMGEEAARGNHEDEAKRRRFTEGRREADE